MLQKYFDSLPDKTLFVTSLDRRTAAIYPIAVWRATEEFFENCTADPEAAETTYFNATQLGQEVEMDGQGRVLFNTELRKVAKLDGVMLHFYAFRGHIEVLPDDMFKEREQNATVKAVTSLDSCKKLGLR